MVIFDEDVFVLQAKGYKLDSGLIIMRMYRGQSFEVSDLRASISQRHIVLLLQHVRVPDVSSPILETS